MTGGADQDSAAVTIDFGRRVLRLRTAGAALRLDVRTLVVSAIIVAAAIGVAALAITMGDYPISPEQLVQVLRGDPDVGFASTVVWEWRLPRTLAAILFGLALGASGSIFQSITRNPLASPDIIGFSTGAYTGALIGLVVLGAGYASAATGAFLGGLSTAVLVYLLAYRRGTQGFRIIIVGIGISAMLGSVNGFIVLRAELGAAMVAALWGTGTLNTVSWADLAIAAPTTIVLLGLSLAFARPMRQLELGDDSARALGVNAESTRLILVVLGVGLVAIATAAAGPITFVALVAPQLARRVAGAAGTSIAASAFTGALLLAAADLVGQHLLPSQVPVGIVTVVLGGGYLGWLLFREGRRR